MYSDNEIQRDISAELKWEPSLRNDDIAIGVREGVVTLGGFVDSYADKKKADQVAARIKGVKAIANELEVKLPSFYERTDPEIARAALEHLRWNISVPHEKIRVKVEKGWLTLEGEAEWHYQKEAAEKAVHSLIGVKGVTNLIYPGTQADPERRQETDQGCPAPGGRVRCRADPGRGRGQQGHPGRDRKVLCRVARRGACGP